METFDLYSWVYLPFIVFFARIADVTLGTLRIVFTSRGRKEIAPFLGFVEVFIWIVVVGQIVKNVHSTTAYFGYAAGFAVGTFIGLKIEEKLALGKLIVRIILAKNGDEVAKNLRDGGFGVTIVNGEGASGAVKLLYTVIKRKELKSVTSIIHSTNPTAFYSVEEVRSSESGIFPVKPHQINRK